MINFKTILKESELNCIHQDFIEYAFEVYHEIVFHEINLEKDKQK